MDILHLVYSFITWWAFGMFSIFNYYEHFHKNFMWMYVFISLRLYLSSGILGSYGNFMFHFLRNCYSVFQSGCTILYYYQHVWGFQFLHILGNTYYCVFKILVILVSVKWYFTVVLICISLMTTDPELCMCLLVTYISLVYLLSSLPFVLVCEGYHNKMPHNGWLKQQKFIFLLSGRWKYKIRVSANFVSPMASLFRL